LLPLLKKKLESKKKLKTTVFQKIDSLEER